MSPVESTLAALVAFPTVSSRPVEAIAAYLADRCSSAGMRVERFETSPGKCNVVASAGPAGTDGLVISGHMDVVPVEGQPWTSDPFVLTPRGDRLVARGSADMKGFLAATVEALPSIPLARLQRELVFVYTHDEEVGCLGSRAVADRLLAEWPDLDGAEKPPVLNALLSRPAWTMKLLDAIAAGKVRRTELGVAQARQIRALHDDALTQRLTDTWGAIQDTEEATKRAAILSWRQKLGPEALKRADPAEGRKLYMQSCGACHLLYGAGGTIGPDLTGSGRQNLDYLLENILFPSAIVAPEFRQTTLTLKDGRSLSGVIRSRNNQAVVIQMIGETATVGLSDIAQQETSPLSLMPEGLLDALTGAQALDLVSYLMSSSPPAGR